MDIEERIAGTITKAEADKLYLDAAIGEEEYREILEGQGWWKPTAHAALIELHQAHAPAHWPRPQEVEVNGSLPPQPRPGRKPTRGSKDGARLTGHPLDEVT